MQKLVKYRLLRTSVFKLPTRQVKEITLLASLRITMKFYPHIIQTKGINISDF